MLSFSLNWLLVAGCWLLVDWLTHLQAGRVCRGEQEQTRFCFCGRVSLLRRRVWRVTQSGYERRRQLPWRQRAVIQQRTECSATTAGWILISSLETDRQVWLKCGARMTEEAGTAFLMAYSLLSLRWRAMADRVTRATLVKASNI